MLRYGAWGIEQEDYKVVDNLDKLQCLLLSCLVKIQAAHYSLISWSTKLSCYFAIEWIVYDII